MMKGGSLVSNGITHAAALLIGWGGWTASQRAGVTDPQYAATTVTKERERHAGGARSLEEISAIISPTTTDAVDKTSAGGKDEHIKFAAEFDQLVRTMEVPDDLKDAVAAEMKLWDKGNLMESPKMAALFYFWADKDFPGLIKWADLNDEDKTRALRYHMAAIVGKAMDGKGWKAMLEISKDPDWGSNILYYTASKMAKSPDLAQLTEAKETLDSKQWRDFKQNLGSTWSWTDKAKLVELAVSENQPDLILRFARFQWKNSAEAGTWLLEMMNDETMDAGFREKLAKDGNLKNLASSTSKLPLATRVGLLQGGDPTASPDQRLYDQLTTNDVKSEVEGDGDWNYEFRHGNVEADEILAEISARIPDLAAKSPEVVRKTLFQNLIEEDSGRAMKLLEDLPPADRAKAVLDATQTAFFMVNPNQFLAALQQVPPNDPELWGARLNAWVNHGPDNYQRLDTGYVSWVRALPEGVDRDMALYSLAEAAQEDNPTLAAELRGEVKNGKLQRKIGGGK